MGISMRCFLYGFPGFFISAILAAFAITSYGNYSARAILSNTMASIDPLKIQIAETILDQGIVANIATVLQPELRLESFPLADYLKVDTDGTIVFRSAARGQIIVLESTFQTDKVSWRRTGSKLNKNWPTSCR